MSAQEPSNNEESKVSLTTFIEENHKTLAVIGVLTALSVFWRSQPLKAISSIISFLCLAATIPLFLEVYRNHLFKKLSFLLRLFLEVFVIMMGYTAWYVLVSFQSEGKFQVLNLVFLFFVAVLWTLYRKLKVRQRIVTNVERFFDYVLSLRLVQKLRERKSKKLISEFLKLDDEQRKQHIARLQEKGEKAGKRADILMDVLFFMAILLASSKAANLTAPFVSKRLQTVYDNYKKTDSPTTQETPKQEQ